MKINIFIELKRKLDTRNVNYFNLICGETKTAFKAKKIKGVKEKMDAINSMIRWTFINEFVHTEGLWTVITKLAKQGKVD